ncbi:MAG: ABC transporter ATP-binding protein [Candidatus Aminicenantes bacterium]|nr:MAG: ABC transporter ATP-binding protein [Candidatus Aminicenantes bacterium]
MLELKNLSKRYGVIRAVDDVTFRVKPGEILGYLGPNGAGKTTTIKILAGLLEPTSGSIFYQGEDVRGKMTAFKRIIGYVPEEPAVYPHLSALEYLELVGRLRGLPEKLLEKKITGLLEVFQLSTDMYSPISTYSKGMTQKVLLAAALLHDPEVLLLDEPLAGLDVATSLVIKDLLKELAQKGKIIIFSSHILEVVEKICSRVIIIHQGKVVADDEVANLRSLMKLPSLEAVFSQLVVKENPEEKATRLLELITLKS